MSKITKYALSDLYDMSSGLSSKKEQAGHGAPFVSFGTVFNNYFLPEELPDLMDTNEKEQQIYSIKTGDVLITRTSETIDELAMSCVAVKDYPKATYSGFTKRLRPKREGIAYPKYMAFYFRSALFRDIFTFLDVYLPDYDEQVRIGDMLYNIECKIQKNKEINDYLEEMAKTIYDYWFVQFDFPNENGKPYKSSGGKMVNSNGHIIPESWTFCKVQDIISNICTGLNPRDNFKLGTGDIKYITVKNLTPNGTLDFTGCDTIDESARTIVHNRSDIQIGDILFASIAPLGRCYLIQSEPTDWDINESVFSIRANTDIITPAFLYLYFMSDAFIKHATSSSTGSIFKGIRINTLLETELCVPPLSVILKFEERLASIFPLKSKNYEEIQRLSNLRDWLLPMLMNGQATIED
ncbi:restriction endonuclease subunit S [Blautia stercoris]